MSKSYLVTLPEAAEKAGIGVTNVESILARELIASGLSFSEVRGLRVEEADGVDQRLARLVLLVHEMGKRLPFVGISALKNQAMSRRSTGTPGDDDKDHLVSLAERRGVLSFEEDRVVLDPDHPLVRATLAPLRPPPER